MGCTVTNASIAARSFEQQPTGHQLPVSLVSRRNLRCTQWLDWEGRWDEQREAWLESVVMGEWNTVQMYAEGLKGVRDIEMKGGPTNERACNNPGSLEWRRDRNMIWGPDHSQEAFWSSNCCKVAVAR